MQLTIPTYFTLFRLVLIPLMILFYFLLPPSQSHFYAALMFLIASITDYIDGYLARKLNATSNFGKFLDPVADKLIVCCALVLIVFEYQDSKFNIFVTLCSLIILIREFFITSLREWMAGLGMSANVSVSSMGKWKTTAQMFAIVYLIWRPNVYSSIWIGQNWIEYITLIVFFVSVVLTIWSMIIYIKASITAFKNIEGNK